MISVAMQEIRFLTFMGGSSRTTTDAQVVQLEPQWQTRPKAISGPYILDIYSHYACNRGTTCPCKEQRKLLWILKGC